MVDYIEGKIPLSNAGFINTFPPVTPLPGLGNVNPGGPEKFPTPPPVTTPPTTTPKFRF